MAVIASVIGAGGLGDRVYQALSSVDVGAALAAGIPIVLLAVVLDRVTGAASEHAGPAPRTPPRCAAGAAGPSPRGAVVVALPRASRTATGWPAGSSTRPLGEHRQGVDGRPHLHRRARRRRHRRLGLRTSPPGSSTRSGTACWACPGGRCCSWSLRRWLIGRQTALTAVAAMLPRSAARRLGQVHRHPRAGPPVSP